MHIQDIVWDNLSTEKLKFILNQAEKKIDNMTEEANIHYTRSVAIITISLSILTVLVGYIFKSDEPIENRISAVVIGALLLVVGMILKENILPTKFITSGSSPAKMLDIVFYENLKEKEDGEFHVLINQVKEAQNKITVNEAVNEKRGGNLKRAISLLYWCPVIVFIVYGSIRLLSLC